VFVERRRSPNPFNFFFAFLIETLTIPVQMCNKVFGGMLGSQNAPFIRLR
jgi:hypothetical protein